jgi:PAS domain S-box-containing protein
MHDSSGELDRIISSMIEVTARKHAEDALRESEARFRHLADSAPAFIWLTDEKGDLTFVNRHFKHVFDRPAELIVPDGWRDLIHIDDMSSFVAEFARSLRAKRPFRSEVRVLDRSGHVRWLRADAVRRLDGR